MGAPQSSAGTSPEALATLLLEAERVVLLSGLRLGGPGGREAARPRGEWSRRASLDVFLTGPSHFWSYYYPRAVRMAARTPGPGHYAVARLQRAGLVRAVITQAVDRLHTKAGSSDVVEVYGNVLSARCQRCGERYGLPEVGAMIAAADDGVPRCTSVGCAFPLRPTGTLWGEPLPPQAVSRAWELAGETDCFVVVDSELRTAPISLLPSVPLTRKVPLVMVGEAPTQYDRYAALVVREPSPPTLTALADLLAPHA
jgi:NAD-dependent protein deacetylase/lipoamidase